MGKIKQNNKEKDNFLSKNNLWTMNLSVSPYTLSKIPNAKVRAKETNPKTATSIPVKRGTLCLLLLSWLDGNSWGWSDVSAIGRTKES